MGFMGSRRGRYAYAYGISALFYCMSLKNNMGGWYNADRGISSRDIEIIQVHRSVISKMCSSCLIPLRNQKLNEPIRINVTFKQLKRRLLKTKSQMFKKNICDPKP